MSGPNLLNEFACCVGAMTGATDQYLQGLGIPTDLMYGGASYVGVGHAELSDDETYQPYDDGAQVLVVPVGIQGALGWDLVADIVAFRPRDPAKWWRRTGNGVVLNPEGIRRAEHFDELLAVWASPLSWLRSGGQGVVVLDWSAHLPFWFSGVGALACEDATLARRLESAFKVPTVKPPEVRVIRPEMSHAA